MKRRIDRDMKVSPNVGPLKEDVDSMIDVVSPLIEWLNVSGPEAFRDLLCCKIGRNTSSPKTGKICLVTSGSLKSQNVPSCRAIDRMYSASKATRW